MPFPALNCPVLLFSLVSFKRFIPHPIFPILLSHLSDFAKTSSDVPIGSPQQQLTFPKNFCRPVTHPAPLFPVIRFNLLNQFQLRCKCSTTGNYTLVYLASLWQTLPYFTGLNRVSPSRIRTLSKVLVWLPKIFQGAESNFILKIFLIF